MNSEQINLVQASFQQVRPIAATAANLFYGRLFELDPGLRPMFRKDLEQQGRLLMTMLGAAVNGLTKLDTVVPVIRDLGNRHAGYGVRDEHYDTVGSALLWTLEQGLGEAFTGDVREAWTCAYELLSDVMKLGALEGRSAREAQEAQAAATA
jgi:hemoglobin-like flavoprotein